MKSILESMIVDYVIIPNGQKIRVGDSLTIIGKNKPSYKVFRIKCETNKLIYGVTTCIPGFITADIF